jgi:RNA polymerase sigma-70 factor (ECF subfamily)
MLVPPSESFADVMQRLREADPQAASVVFRRYAERLAAVARARLGERLQAKVDADDVLQSAYRTFFRRHAAGEFDLDGWDGLWALLTVLTIRKCGRWREHFHAAIRDVRREVSTDAASESAPALQPESREPAPDEAACLEETVQSLLRGLGTRDRDIVSLRLQGYSALEVAAELRLPQRTVFRVLERVKRHLRRQRDDDAGSP